MNRTNHISACESAKTVPKMKSLILFLFLGATVALAEILEENDPYRKHHHHPMLKECMEKCGIMKPTMPGELADEENDPHPHHHHHHPSLSPDERKCVHECLEEYKPSHPPPNQPGKVADEKKKCDYPDVTFCD